jgi:hypothetical protein
MFHQQKIHEQTYLDLYDSPIKAFVRHQHGWHTSTQTMKVKVTSCFIYGE